MIVFVRKLVKALFLLLIVSALIDAGGEHLGCLTPHEVRHLLVWTPF